jgi:hypothetical protein
VLQYASIVFIQSGMDDGALSKFADGSNAEALNCAAHTHI